MKRIFQLTQTFQLVHKNCLVFFFKCQFQVWKTKQCRVFEIIVNYSTASFPLTNCGQAKNQSAQPSYSPSQNFTTIVKAPIISLFVWYNNKLREFFPFLVVVNNIVCFYQSWTAEHDLVHVCSPGDGALPSNTTTIAPTSAPFPSCNNDTNWLLFNGSCYYFRYTLFLLQHFNKIEYAKQLLQKFKDSMILKWT